MYLWITVIALLVIVSVGLSWRELSRRFALPFPALFAVFLESVLLAKLLRTEATLDCIDLRPGQSVLEVGPGPGRLLIPAAQRILPGGSAVGLDIQSGMIRRLQARAKEFQLENVIGIVGDAAEQTVRAESFDIVILCTVLGEIPNSKAALKQIYLALRPGGVLSVTEILLDPHFQAKARVRRLALDAGFRFQRQKGSWAFYTSNFAKPITHIAH